MAQDKPWERYGSPRPIVAPPPPSPAEQYEPQQAAANVERTQAQTQGDAISNQVAAGTAPTTIQTNQAPAGYIWIDPNDPEKGVRPIPGYESQQAEQIDPQKLGNMRSLQQLLTRLQGLYALGPGSTEGVAGVADYLPTENNRRFNTVAAGLGDVGFAAFRVPGSGVQTDADQKRFIEANTPSTWDTDVQIQEKLANVQTRLNETAAAFGLDPEELTSPLPSAFDVIRTDGGAGQERKPAEAGSTTESLAAPPQMVQEHDEMVALLASQNGGRIDPDQYAAERARLDAKYNRQGNVEDYKGWATSVNDYLDAGGRTIPTGIQDETRVMSMTDTLRNNLVSNPVGAAATGYFNAGGMGALNALAPDQAAALADAYPLSSLGGEIGGAITGTALLGGLARNTVGRAAPRLLGNGPAPTLAGRYVPQYTGGQTARNIGTDAAYAAAYSANSGDDIATGTALGVGGSAFGQALGKLTGAAVGGLTTRPSAQRMIDAGVPLTVPQRIGGWAKAAEEKATSVPLLGDVINARHMDGRRAFNRGAFNIGAETIPGDVTETGFDAVRQLNDFKGTAYSNALDPVTLNVTDSDTMRQGLMNAQLGASTIPRVGDDASEAIGYRFSAVDDAGNMTGRDFQEAYRGLGRDGRSAANGDYAFEYGQSMREAQDVLARGLEEQHPGAFRDFTNANEANRRLNVLADAVHSAKNQEDQLFTPKQLAQADATSASRLTGRITSSSGNRPFARYAADGVDAIANSTPDSGTAGRVAQMAAGGTILGGGSGLGYLAGGDLDSAQQGAGYSAALAVLLASLGTRKGQQLMQQVAFERPSTAQRVGRAISSRRGLFGSAMLPVVAQD